jgi:hypothetical protein
VVHLNELHEKYSDKGLTVLAVSGQSGAAIEAFIEEFGCTYPTVSEKTNSARAYGATGVPRAYLINSNGRILWIGHPGELPDSKIEEALEQTKILPPWRNALKSVKKAFLKDKYAVALALAEKEIEKGRLDEADLTAAEAIREWIVWYGSSTLEGAKADIEGGKLYEASRNLEHLSDLYAKHDYATQADAALKELLADPERKLEVKAGEKLAKALAAIQEDELKPKKALAKLKPLLGNKYAETAAGKTAAELAEKLEAELD